MQEFEIRPFTFGLILDLLHDFNCFTYLFLAWLSVVAGIDISLEFEIIAIFESLENLDNHIEPVTVFLTLRAVMDMSDSLDCTLLRSVSFLPRGS